ncbi:fatty acyl-CoA reductase 2, chloroplastic-like [Andrographis paniculata]|uniref:fatty acyl-CoA reductase 2, chloroplastic-like n=1 Tax=Andrographis paniculata TaxID=175694 RepID=UPI0021E8DAEB|nr:fatty acyl-CoA reductase 2, chloroplastic-like [Andrographis paniculata]
MFLIAPNSFSCFPTTNLSFEKSNSQNPRVSFVQKYSNNKFRSSRKMWELGVNFNGYPYFTSPRHPLESELSLGAATQVDSNGVGIENFFQGKNILITGATGLVGKALVEKLLRSTSVDKIYVLIKADDNEGAADRLSKEIMYSNLFETLQEKYGSSYKEFAREKLIPVVGNICEPNLGMDTKSAQTLMDNVDVIIASAASTTLNARYDELINENTIAPQRLLRFAKRCKNLKVFVHMSTAYVNGRREGVIYETPWIMGENARKVDEEMPSSAFPRLDLSDEINLATKTCMGLSDHDATKALRRLGQERATFYGWYNAYHLTKAMGEMVLEESRGDVPVLIIRPSVIEGSYKDPIPGWIQGNRMYDPVIISYGKGLLPGYLADPEAHVDIVPVDMVVNTTVAAAAKHGIISKPGLNVYHATTDFVNPLQYSDFFNHMHEHFSKYPLTKSKAVNKMEFFDEFNNFSKHIRQELSEQSGMSHIIGLNGNSPQSRLQKQYKAKVMYAEQLCKMYEFAGFFKARFHSGNTRKLLEEMSEEERRNFEVDATKIDWRKYLVEAHIPGLRKHVLHESKISV